MRKKLYVLTSFVLMICSLFMITQSVVYADDSTIDSLTLSVCGQACIEVAPDKATLYGSVQTTGDTETAVKDMLLQNYSELKQTLDLDENSIKINGYHFNASNNFGQVSHYGMLNFSITINNLEEVENVTNKIWDMDYAKIHNVCYEVSDENNGYAEALAQAVQNAKNKAQIIIGDNTSLNVIKIIEESDFGGVTLCRSANETFENADLIQNVSVCARVRVVFG